MHFYLVGNHRRSLRVHEPRRLFLALPPGRRRIRERFDSSRLRSGPALEKSDFSGRTANAPRTRTAGSAGESHEIENRTRRNVIEEIKHEPMPGRRFRHGSSGKSAESSEMRINAGI